MKTLLFKAQMAVLKLRVRIAEHLANLQQLTAKA